MADISPNNRSLTGLGAFTASLGDEAFQEKSNELRELASGEVQPNPDQRLAADLGGLFAGMFGGDKAVWPVVVRNVFESIEIGVGLGSFNNSLTAALQDLRTDEVGFMAFDAALQVMVEYPEFSEVARNLSAAVQASNIIPEGAARAGLSFASSPFTLFAPILVGGTFGRIATTGVVRVGQALGLTGDVIAAFGTVFGLTVESAGFVATSDVVAQFIGQNNGPINGATTFIEETAGATFLFSGLRMFSWAGSLAQTLLPATELGAAIAKLFGHTVSVTGLATMDKVQVAAGIAADDSATYYEALVRAFFLHGVISLTNSVFRLNDANSEYLEIRQRAELMTEFLKRLAVAAEAAEAMIPSPLTGEGQGEGEWISLSPSPLNSPPIKGGGIRALSTGSGNKGGSITISDLQALGKTNDEREVLRRAILDLKDTQGKRRKDAAPSAGDILSAVKRVYRGLFSVTGSFDSSQQYTVGKLTKVLSDWMDEAKAAALNIQGTKEPEKKETSRNTTKKTKEATLKNLATRISMAASLTEEIVKDAAKIPPYHVESMVRNGEQEPAEKAKGAATHVSNLRKFGDRAEAILADLKGRPAYDIKDARETIEALENLRAEMRSLLHEATVAFETDEIDQFMGYIQADVNLWMKELPPEQKVHEGILEKVVRNYVGFWLDRNSANLPQRLTFSSEELYDAVLKTGRDLKAEVPKELARAMIEFLAFTEARKDRKKADSSAADDGVARRPLIIRPILDDDDLARQIGTTLTDGYKAFFKAILAGESESVKDLNERERRDLALRWREAFHYMVLYGTGTHGEHFNEEHIRRTGLEPMFIRPIFRRLKDANIYTDQVLELMREFFRTHVTSDEGLVPTVDKLKPRYLRPTGAAAAVSMDKRFITSKKDGMEGLTEQMWFIEGIDDFEEMFEEAAGIKWKTFKGYGRVRGRPEALSRQMIEAFVDDIIPAGQLKQFLLEHTPMSVEWQLNWAERVEKADTDGKLKELALSRDYRTDVVTADDWKKYVDYSIANGHQEDVTAGPASENYIGIMKAFSFLSELAAQYGLYIDAVDFLSEISPAIKRMRDSAIDGVIAVEIPSFMRKILFRNIGQPTFTQKMLEKGLSSLVKESTLAEHKSGETKNPLYTTLRKNAEALAAQEMKGGRDRRVTEDNIYLLQVMFRFGYFLENFALVLNALGSKESFVPDETPTRYTIRLVSDAAEYRRSEGIAARRVQDEMMIKVRDGYYEKLIEKVRDYLVAIQRLPFKYELVRADGTVVQMQELLSVLEEFESRHSSHSTTLKGDPGRLTVEAIEGIERSYKELGSFAQDVLFFLRVRGEVDIKDGRVLFDAAPRIEGYRYDSSSIGRVTIFLDDLERVAQAERWPEVRRHALITMRALIGQLLLEKGLATDEMDNAVKLAAAVRDRWPMDERLIAPAVDDLIRLEKGAIYSRLVDTAGDLARKPGTAQKQPARPALPWWAPEWDKQFNEMAKANGLGTKTIDAAASAMRKYVETVKGFRKFYFGNLLDGLIGKHLRGSEDAEVAEVAKVIREFMQKIGLPVDESKTEEKAGKIKKTPDDIAHEAIEKYAALFVADAKLDEQLVEDEELLKDLVNLLCLEYDQVEATQTFERARDILRTFNRGKSPSLLLAAQGEEKLPQTGLLTKRIAGLSAEDRQRFYQALPEIAGSVIPAALSGNPANSIEGSRSPITTSGMTSLDAAVNGVKASLDIWKAIIDDPETGFLKHFDKKFTVRYFSAEKLRQFALDFGRLIILTEGRVDVLSLSRDKVTESFAPYANITEKMARYMRFLLEEYLASRSGIMGLVAELAREVLDETFKKTPYGDISTWQKFYQVAVSRDRDGLLQRAVREEAHHSLLVEILGGEVFSEGIMAYAEGVFAKVRERCELAAQAQRIYSEDMDAKAVQIKTFINEVARFSLETYLPKDINLLDREACERAASQMGQGLEILLGLEKKAATLTAVLERVDELAVMLGDMGMPELAQPERLDQAEELRSGVKDATAKLKELKDGLIKGKSDIGSRLKEIGKEEDLARANRRADSLLADIKGVVSKLDALLKRKETEVVEVTATLEADIEKFEIDTSSYERVSETLNELKKMFEDRFKVIETSTDDIRKVSKGIDINRLKEDAARLMDRLGDEKRVELETAVKGLKEKKERLGAPEEDQDESAKRASGLLAIFLKRTVEAEAKLPIMPLVGPPKPQTLPAGNERTIQGIRVGFNREAPQADSRLLINKALREILDGKIVSCGNGSVIVPAQEAARIQAWHDGGRLVELVVRDILGNEQHLSRGMRIAGLESDPSFAKIKGLLELILKENSNEGLMLVQLMEKRESGLPLLYSLFATIMNEPAVAGPEEAKSFVRRWGLSGVKSIQDALGKRARAFFVELPVEGAKAPDAPAKEYPLAKEWKAEHGSEWTDKEQEKEAAAAGSEIGDSIWGMLSVRGKVDASSYLVEPRSYAEFMNGERDTLITMDGDRKVETVKEGDLKELFSDPEMTLDKFRANVRFDPPPADDPVEVRRFRTEYKIYSDPVYRPLGWVLEQVKDKKMFCEHIWREYLDTGMPLVEAQEKVLEEYQRYFVDSGADHMEVLNVPAEFVLKWFERTFRRYWKRAGGLENENIDAKIEEAKEVIGSQNAAMYVHRILMILTETIFKELPVDKGTEDEEFIKKLIINNIPTRKGLSRDWSPLVREVRAFYFKHREQVLQQMPRLRELTGSLNPTAEATYYVPDSEMEKLFPETGAVTIAAQREMLDVFERSESDDQVMTTLTFAMREFPKLHGMWALIFIADRWSKGALLSQKIAQFKDIIDRYTSTPPAEFTEDVEVRARDELLALYKDIRPDVLANLHDIEFAAERGILNDMKKDLGLNDFDLENLMNRKDAWEPKSAGWEGVSPLERLKAVAPELFLVKPEMIEKFKVVTNSSNFTGTGERSAIDRRLMTDFPELAGAVVIGGFVAADDKGISRRDKLGSEYLAAVRNGDERGREYWLGRFTQEFLDPEFVMSMRLSLQSKKRTIPGKRGSMLDGPAYRGWNDKFKGYQAEFFTALGGKLGQTVAELLTGMKEPWLADLAEIEGAKEIRNTQDARRTTSSEEVQKWEAEFGAEYTPAEHAERREDAKVGLEMSTWGKLDVRDASGKWTHLFVAADSGEAYVDGKSTMVHAFDREKGTLWIDLKVIADKGVKEATFTPPLARNPRELNLARIALQIFSDPSLRPLGWLVREIEAEKLNDGLAQYIMGCLENNPGLSLLELQNEALRAYGAYIHGVSSKPEVQYASVEWLDGYLDGIRDRLEFSSMVIADLKEVIRKSNTARFQMAMLAYLDQLKVIKLDVYLANTIGFIAEGRGFDGVIAGLESEEKFNETIKLYSRYRQDVIEKIKGVLQDATGRARPWLSWILTPPDSDMLERFPETGRVFPQRMKRDWSEELHDRGDGTKNLLSLAVLNFPEFLPIWTFINAVTSGGKHDTVGFSAVLNVLEEFGKIDVRAAEGRIGEFKSKILDYYGSIRETVLEILRKMPKNGTGSNALESLTGSQGPEATGLNDWSGVKPIEHLKAVVPEFFMVTGSAALALLRHCADKPAILDHYKRFPELALASIFAMVVTGTSEEARSPAGINVKYLDAINRGETINYEAFIKEYVEASLDPIYIAALRGTLNARLVRKGNELTIEGYSTFDSSDKGKFEHSIAFLESVGGKPGQTIGEILFGTKGPWIAELTEIEAAKEVRNTQDARRTTSSEEVQKWEAEFGAEYTPERHAQLAAKSRELLELSVWGGLQLTDVSGKTWMLHVTPESAETYVRGDATKVRVFDPKMGVGEMELKDGVGGNTIASHEYFPPSAARLGSLNTVQRTWQVYQDPDLRPLGWLTYNFTTGVVDSDLARYVWGCIGNSPGLSLIEVQDEAMKAYWRYQDGDYPEIDLVRVEDLVNETMKEHASAIKEKIKEDASLKRLMSMLILMEHVDKELVREHISRLFSEPTAKQLGEVTALYRKNRARVLEDKEFLSGVTRQHRPWMSFLFTPLDDEMVNRFPETGAVYPGRIRERFVDVRSFKGDELEKDGLQLHLMTAQRLFPELSGMFELLSTAMYQSDTFPRGAIKELSGIVGEYLKLPPAIDDAVVGTYKDRILALYERIRPEVRKILEDKMAHVWEARPNDPMELDPMERLKTVLPEFSMIRPDIMKKLRSKTKSGNPVFEFMDDLPELAALAVFEMVVHGSGKELKEFTRVRENYQSAIRSGQPVDRAAYIKEFVDTVLNPVWVGCLRGTLNSRLVIKKGVLTIEGFVFDRDDRAAFEHIIIFMETFGGKPGQTVGEVLFGTKGPWLDGDRKGGGQNVNVIDTAAEGLEIDRLGPEIDSYINRTEANKGDRSAAEVQRDLDEAINEYNETQFPELRYIKLNELNRFVDRGYREIIQIPGNGKGARNIREGIGLMAGSVKAIVKDDATVKRHVAILMLMNGVGDKDAQQYVYEILLKAGRDHDILKDPASIAETEMLYRKARELVLKEKRGDLQKWSGLQRPWLSEHWAVPDPKMMEKFPETGELYPPMIRERWKSGRRSDDEVKDAYHIMLRVATHVFPELLPMWALMDIGLIEGNVVSEDEMARFKVEMEKYRELPLGTDEGAIEAFKETFMSIYEGVRPYILKVAQGLRLIKLQDARVQGDISRLPVVIEWETEFGNDWTLEMHAKKAETMAEDIRLAAWGTVKIKQPDGSMKTFRVEPKSFAAAANGEKKTATVLDNGVMAKMDIADTVMNMGQDETVRYDPPIADSAVSLKTYQLYYKVFSDPDLRPVGWLLLRKDMKETAVAIRDRLIAEILPVNSIVTEIREMSEIIESERDKPGSTPVNFTNMAPLARIEMIVPELFKINSKFARVFNEYMAQSPGNVNREQLEAIEVFITQHPELAGAALMDVYLPLNEEWASNIMQLYSGLKVRLDRVEEIDWNGYTNKFVELHTSARYIHYLRGLLSSMLILEGAATGVEQRYAVTWMLDKDKSMEFANLLLKCGGKKGQTVGEILTGYAEPWLNAPKKADTSVEIEKVVYNGFAETFPEGLRVDSRTIGTVKKFIAGLFEEGFDKRKIVQKDGENRFMLEAAVTNNYEGFLDGARLFMNDFPDFAGTVALLTILPPILFSKTAREMIYDFYKGYTEKIRREGATDRNTVAGEFVAVHTISGVIGRIKELISTPIGEILKSGGAGFIPFENITKDQPPEKRLTDIVLKKK